jgi:hypothetical protein
MQAEATPLPDACQRQTRQTPHVVIWFHVRSSEFRPGDGKWQFQSVQHVALVRNGNLLVQAFGSALVQHALGRISRFAR